MVAIKIELNWIIKVFFRLNAKKCEWVMNENVFHQTNMAFVSNVAIFNHMQC